MPRKKLLRHNVARQSFTCEQELRLTVATERLVCMIVSSTGLELLSRHVVAKIRILPYSTRKMLHGVLLPNRLHSVIRFSVSYAAKPQPKANRWALAQPFKALYISHPLERAIGTLQNPPENHPCLSEVHPDSEFGPSVSEDRGDKDVRKVAATLSQTGRLFRACPVRELSPHAIGEIPNQRYRHQRRC